MKSRAFEILMSAAVLAVLGTVIWATKSSYGPGLFSGRSSSQSAEQDYADSAHDETDASWPRPRAFESGRDRGLLAETHSLPAYVAFEKSLNDLRKSRSKLLSQATAESSEDLVDAAEAYRQAVRQAQAKSQKLRSIVTPDQWKRVMHELAPAAQEDGAPADNLSHELNLKMEDESNAKN